MSERMRARLGERAAAMALAVLLEGLLGLLLLTLAPAIVRREEPKITIFSMNAEPDAEPAPVESEPETEKARPARQPPKAEQPAPAPDVTPPKPAPPAPPLLVMSRDQLAAADISAMPPAPAKPASGPKMIGPPDTGNPGDSQRVSGQGPHGEPLYAAAWYREPYDDELSGYLSTAQGPGWGLIACRTVPDYRVEDCVALDEYPRGSNINRAILAAAWQFRVRPPRVGGRYKVGEWVRIRIDYDMRPGPR